MKLWKWVVIFGVLIILGAGAYQLVQTNVSLEERLGEFSGKLTNLENENRYLASQIEFLQNPENLLKEIKAQFNYRQAGEELIIIVPRD